MSQLVMTLEDIRAACVAAGLPGLPVEAPPAIGSARVRKTVGIIQALGLVTGDGMVHRAAYGEQPQPLGLVLERHRHRLEAERRSAATRVAEADRVLGRTGPPARSVIDHLEATGDGWGGLVR